MALLKLCFRNQVYLCFVGKQNISIEVSSTKMKILSTYLNCLKNKTCLFWLSYTADNFIGFSEQFHLQLVSPVGDSLQNRKVLLFKSDSNGDDTDTYICWAQMGLCTKKRTLMPLCAGVTCMLISGELITAH